MTDHDAELEQIARAASELVPELTERLRRSGLGELEVRSGSLRVRVAANPAANGPVTGGPKVVATSAGSAGTPKPGPEPAASTSAGVECVE